MSTARVVLYLGAMLVILYALDWAGTGNNFFMYKFFAPRQESARREVYEQSKAYRQGSIQRLNTLCAQANDTDDSHRPMINDVIAHEFAEWSSSDVPGYLRPCLAAARRNN